MEFTRQLIDAHPCPMYIKNAEGKLILANEAYAALYGQNTATLLANGTPEFDFTLNRDLEVLQAGSGDSFEEFYKPKNSGKGRWFYTVKKPIINQDGNQYLLSVSSDISEQKQSRSKAEAEAGTKATFLTLAGSSIRQSATTIQHLADRLKNSPPAPETSIEVLATVKDKLLLLADAMAAFATLVPASTTAPAAAPLDVLLVLNEAVKTVAPAAAAHHLQVEVVPPAQALPVVEGDAATLLGILESLLKVLTQQMYHSNISIRLSAQLQNPEVCEITCCVAVESTDASAVAMQELLENLQKPAGTSLTGNSPAYLALALCNSLVTLHNGSFFTHTLAGTGFSINLLLPFRVKAPAAASAQHNTTAVYQSLKGLRLLLAEDNQAIRLLACTHLQAWGIEVDLACDGAEAVAKTETQQYDLILMDVEMPNMTGTEATARIRSTTNRNCTTPIIAFTANEGSHDLSTYRTAGFTDCLLKPYLEAKLYAVITKNLTHPIHDLTAPATIASADGLYDFSGLGSLADDPLFIRKMQQLFIDTVPEQLHELNKAVEQNDWATVALAAHRLKSTYANINLQAPTEAMKAIEAIAATKKGSEKLNEHLNTAATVTAKVVTIFSDILQHPL